MATNREYVTQPIAASPYRVDGRATYGQPILPVSANIHGGPHVDIVSGVRDNPDRWPASSGNL